MRKLREAFWRRRHSFAVVLDGCCVVLSYWLSFVVGLSGLGVEYGRLFITTLPLVVVCRLFFMWVFKIHKTSWRYISVTDLENLVKAIAASQALIIVLLVFITRLGDYPRRVFVLDGLILLTLLGGMRFGYRLLRERVTGDTSGEEHVRTLIVGAGDAGERVARSLRLGGAEPHIPVGFVDDDPAKMGLRIHGVPVLGGIADLPSLIELMKVDEVIIATPSATRLVKRQIFAACEKTRVRVKTVPTLHDLMVGKKKIHELSDVDIERLLGRELISTDLGKARGYLEGKRILVTGAGGSIGGEICRQVLEFRPASLILVGKGENSLHDIRVQLAPRQSSTEIHTLLGSVTNWPKMAAVFRRFRPHVVFHAAAHKHIDLTELNPDEAVLNNILGTRCILDASEEVGVERVVVISSDKAADPTSIMGCTKRVVEMMVCSRRNSSASDSAAANPKSEIRNPKCCVGVRFCNVLDSKGSVIPTFRRQIELGGPVTVTDQRMKRYFMTSSEAVELVIQAGAMGRHGDILILDMGESVRIVDLAKQMIRLSGYVEGRDIRIVFTGMRPGEKLEEQLVGRNETQVETENPKIRRIQFKGAPPEPQSLNKDIDYLIEKSIAMDFDAIHAKLREMAPEYTPEAVLPASPESAEIQSS